MISGSFILVAIVLVGAGVIIFRELKKLAGYDEESRGMGLL